VSSAFWRGLAAGSLLMVDLVVTVKPGNDLDVVAAQLVQAGLQVHTKLTAVGSITGSAPIQMLPGCGPCRASSM
jgi:hypothetical protein